MAKRDSTLTNDAIMREYLRAYEAARGVGSTSYADYVRTQGTDPTALYAAAAQTAQRTRDRALASYGTEGERLGQTGNTGGGYADYLNRAAQEALAAKTEEARRSAAQAQNKNLTGYASYIKGQSNQVRGAVNAMRNQGIVGYADAYAYALAAGIDKENAALAASLIDGMEQKPVSASTLNVRYKVLARLIDLSLPQDAAYEYAMACGVDSKTAADLAKTAVEVNEQRNNHRY